MRAAGRFDIRSRCAVIVGAEGQDGTYLAEYLAGLGYRTINIGRDHVVSEFGRRPFSISDSGAVAALIEAEQPDEIYFLATHHHSSEQKPGNLRELIDLSYAVHCRALLNVLDAIVAASPRTRLFYAASSLVFGEPSFAPQNEDTPVSPVCAYGTTKATGMEYCDLFRRERGIYCCSGILYNHESPRRAPRFVSRKIAVAVHAIQKDRRRKLTIGDLNAQVDWSYAGDVVRAMHAVLQSGAPCDYVVASGTLHSVRDFVERAFRTVGLDYCEHVVESSGLIQRNRQKIPLQGDPSRLRAATGWAPAVSFDELVEMMVREEIAGNTTCGEYMV